MSCDPDWFFGANFYANLGKFISILSGYKATCPFQVLFYSVSLILWLSYRDEEVRSYTFVFPVFISAISQWCFEMKHLHSSHTILQLSVPHCINPCNLQCVCPRYRTLICAWRGLLSQLSDTKRARKQASDWTFILTSTHWCTYIKFRDMKHGPCLGRIINAASQNQSGSDA